MVNTGRKPLQGTRNVLRFNWHFYLMAAAAGVLCLLLRPLLPEPGMKTAALAMVFALGSATAASLLASWWVYGASGLYRLQWLKLPSLPEKACICNIHAGFDEFSALLEQSFPDADLQFLDFYDPALHTEVSVARARRAYPAHPGTLPVRSSALPLAPEAAALIFVLFAAHEIRRAEERTAFFRQLCKGLQPGGSIIVAEHLRNGPNLLAYNLGAFHFHTEKSWLKTFRDSGLAVARRQRLTPFVVIYTLRKNGAAA